MIELELNASNARKILNMSDGRKPIILPEKVGTILGDLLNARRIEYRKYGPVGILMQDLHDYDRLHFTTDRDSSLLELVDTLQHSLSESDSLILILSDIKMTTVISDIPELRSYVAKGYKVFSYMTEYDVAKKKDPTVKAILWLQNVDSPELYGRTDIRPDIMIISMPSNFDRDAEYQSNIYLSLIVSKRIYSISSKVSDMMSLKYFSYQMVDRFSQYLTNPIGNQYVSRLVTIAENYTSAYGCFVDLDKIMFCRNVNYYFTRSIISNYGDMDRNINHRFTLDKSGKDYYLKDMKTKRSENINSDEVFDIIPYHQIISIQHSLYGDSKAIKRLTYLMATMGSKAVM